MARGTLTPEQLADGEGTPGVAELIAAIHRVNPTDRGLSEEDEAAAYALKARLQSRLICAWPDHLSFQVDDADIVAIDHTGHHRDAAHVPLWELEPEARTVVCAALHLPEPDAPPPSEHRPMPRLARDPLSRGRRAMAEWDYDQARACFEEAFGHGRSEPAAHALLDLLVSHLGLDGDALAVDVPDRVLSHRVARLLALAAARTGQIGRATDLLAHVSQAAEIEVRVPLAQHCLRRGDASGARAHLQLLRQLDPGNGAILRIEDALSDLDATRVAPQEAALQQAEATGDEGAIRAAAEALLAVSAGHAGARRALDRLDTTAREARAARHLQTAREHEAREHWDLAIRALRRARDEGAEVADALRRARAARDAAARTERILAAAEAVERGELEPYAALAGDERAEVRALQPRPVLETLDAVLADGVRNPLDVLQALGRAEALVDTDPDAARAALDAAGAWRLGCARSLREAAREATAAIARDRAVEALERLEARVAEGDWDDAFAQLQSIAKEALPAAERARFEALRPAVQEGHEVARFDHLVRTLQLLPARDYALERIEARPDGAAWPERLRRLRAMLLRFFPARAVQDPLPACRVVGPAVRFSADACVEPDGRHAWLAESFVNFVLLRRIELATEQVECTLVVRTPAVFTLPRMVVSGGHVTLSSKGGAHLTFRAGDDGLPDRIVAWLNEHPPMAGGQGEYTDPGRHPTCRGVVRELRPQGRPAWVRFERPTTLHLLTDAIEAIPVRTAKGDHTLVHLESGRMVLVGAHHRDREPLGGKAYNLFSAVRHPTEDQVVLVGNFLPDQELAVALFAPGREIPVRRYGLSVPHAVCYPIACARSRDLLVVLARSDHGRSVLIALDGQLRERWRVDAVGLLHLLTDVDDQHIVVARATEEGLRLIPLGTERPELRDDGVLPRQGYVSSEAARDLATGPRNPHRSALAAAIAAADATDDPAAVVQLLELTPMLHGLELQSLARLARASLAWQDGPWVDRLRGVGTFLHVYRTREQADIPMELTDVSEAWPAETLRRLSEEAQAWIVAQEDDMGLLRVGTGHDLQWDGG